MWPYGRGGVGANAPEYNRRLELLIVIRHQYLTMFPERAPFIEAGIDHVPISWVNKRLAEGAENWRVEPGDEGYVLPPLPRQG